MKSRILVVVLLGLIVVTGTVGIQTRWESEVGGHATRLFGCVVQT